MKKLISKLYRWIIPDKAVEQSSVQTVIPKSLTEWVEMDGGWHHLVIVFKGMGHKLYIDGKEARHYDETAYYNVTLTDDQIHRITKEK